LTNATFSAFFDFGGIDGTPGTNQNIDALGPPMLRFKNADDATIDGNDKPTIPAAGTIYSFLKHVYIKCTANASSHTMNNLKFYSDGGNGLGTGLDIQIGLQFPTKNSGSSSGYEVAGNANEMVSEHSIITSKASIFGYTVGEATDLHLSISEGSSVIDAVNETSNYIVEQGDIASTASPGDAPNETMTITYDEY